MRFKRQRQALPAPWRAPVLASLLALPPLVQAADSPAAPQTLKRVEISDKQGDEAKNRNAVAGKIIMGREEIERLGDSRAGELLSRMPSVTVTDGRVSMRGLSGYTQILVDGRNPPAGFNLIELPADQIERIEVIRSGVAEFSAQGMAGTINVVLRQANRSQPRDAFNLELGDKIGYATPSFNWSRERPAQDGGPANLLTLSGFSGDSLGHSNQLTTIASPGNATLQQISTQEDTRTRYAMLSVRSQWQWKQASGESLTLTPNVGVSEVRNWGHSVQQGDGIAFDSAQTQVGNRTRHAGMQLKWASAPADWGRVNLAARASGMQLRRHDDRNSQLQSHPVLAQTTTVDGATRGQDLQLGWTHETASAHSLRAGLDLGRFLSDTEEQSLLDGTPDPIQRPYNGRKRSDTQDHAVFIQDEWTAGNWSFNSGLRWEGKRLDLSLGSQQARHRLQLFAPSGHLLWRPEAKSRDQIRLSFSRSYKAPYDNQLLARPSINPQQPCTISSCQTNSAAYPDVAANPELRPEVSSGVDLGFEHYQGKTGVFSLNLFARHLKDHIRSESRLGPVEWSNAPRWVLRNYNVGAARTMGIELDARGRLNEWLAEAPALEINAGLNLFRSSVEALPGPNNRLAEQPRANAKLGLQYQLPGLPWRLGTQLNWTSATPVRVADQEWRDIGRRLSASFNALWTIDKDNRLRLSYSTPQTSRVYSEKLTASERILNLRDQRAAAGWGLKWETKV